MKLVSACLLGIDCRYNGENCLTEKVIELVSSEVLIPVCPEQLGGLETPREPMRIIDGEGLEVLDGKARVVNESGLDVTEKLVSGAEEVLKIAKLFGINEAILKAKSPSCGSGELGDGVTTAMLKDNGFKVIGEKEL